MHEPASRGSGLIGARTATFVVMANMVGAGVFTSLGFQVAAIHSAFPLLMLWAVGGVYALCGAVSYGELAAAMPRSGGEYQYLSRIYHPAVGFLAGWISITVGFAAPVAAAAMALGKYLSRVLPGANPTVTALVAVAAITGVHLFSVGVRSRFQGFFTSFKLLLIAAFIVGALLLAVPQPIPFGPQPGDLRALFSAPFAVSLVYVTYAYSGWNASVYVAGEVRNPARSIPLSLICGTLVVAALYILLNFVFLYSTPMAALDGQVEVGYVAADAILGPHGGRIMGFLISFGLVSAISSMVWAGPRVLMALGQDMRVFGWLAPLNRHRVPYRAVLAQTALVVVLIVTSSFERVITFLGFVLSACAFLTVLGLFVFRWRWPAAPRPYRTWGYPVTPALFLIVTGWMLVFLLRFRPVESLAGLAVVALGIPVYLWVARSGAAAPARLDGVGEQP
jgi:APA family basic amino acid/polyamine antiporter